MTIIPWGFINCTGLFRLHSRLSISRSSARNLLEWCRFAVSSSDQLSRLGRGYSKYKRVPVHIFWLEKSSSSSISTTSLSLELPTHHFQPFRTLDPSTRSLRCSTNSNSISSEAGRSPFTAEAPPCSCFEGWGVDGPTSDTHHWQLFSSIVCKAFRALSRPLAPRRWLPDFTRALLQ